MNLAITTLILLSTSAMAADITDILFKRGASVASRHQVSKTLLNSQANPILTTDEAIAELCYGIDLCAGETPQEQVDKQCADHTYTEGPPSFECQIKNFRARNSCEASLPKQSLNAVRLMQRIIGDYKKVYATYIMPNFESYLKSLNIDFDNKQATEEYLEQNPEVRAQMEEMYNELGALGQYTLDCYGEMNRVLYSNDKKKLARYFNLFSSTINTMTYFTPYQQMVNRGATLPASVLKEYHKVGNIVCSNGFTSTAVHDPETDRGDEPRNSFLEGKCTQRLYIKYENNGAPAGRLIDNGSASKGENEVLLEPGACFRIDQVHPRTDNSGSEDAEICSEGQRYNFEMTLLPSK